MMLSSFVVLMLQATSAQAALPLGGPEIPGVCLLSRQAVFANAKAAVAAQTRLEQITAEAQTEIAADRAPVDKDAAAYTQGAAKMTAEQRTQRLSELEARMAPVRAKADQRSREIDATRVKAMTQISDAAQPLIAQVYATRKCGLLIDRNSVLGGNFANDLTADVVKALDAKLTTISFNREVLPAAAPAKKP